jgi:hypothetical protein
MKTLKLTIATVIAACTFQAANAQISVGVRIGTPPPRRVVVVSDPVYAEPYYERPVYREEYYSRPVYNRVIVERAPYRRVYYNRGYYGRPVYHESYYRHVRYNRWHH